MIPPCLPSRTPTSQRRNEKIARAEVTVGLVMKCAVSMTRKGPGAPAVFIVWRLATFLPNIEECKDLTLPRGMGYPGGAPPGAVKGSCLSCSEV